MNFLQSIYTSARADSYPKVYSIPGDSAVAGKRLKIHIPDSKIKNGEPSAVDLMENNVRTVTLNSSNLRDFQSIFNGSFFDTVSDYRKIKENETWCKIYNVSEMSWHYEIAGVLSNPRTRVVVCRQCGVLIPLKVASIDHQAPQTGGQDKAMLRFFRVADCTVGGGVGAKFNAIHSLVHKDRNPIGNDVDPSSIKSTKEERYTLNAAGLIYYSLIRHAGLLDEFARACMHSGFNLRPVCPPCNSRVSNGNTGIG